MRSTRLTNHGGFLYEFDNRFKTLDGALNAHDLLLFILNLSYKTPFNVCKPWILHTRHIIA